MLRLTVAAVAIALFTAPFASAADEAKKAERQGKIAQMLFSKADADNDGKLSKDEFLKVADVLKEKLGDKAPDAEKLAAFFTKADKDSDGFVTLEELKAAGPIAARAKATKKKPEAA